MDDRSNRMPPKSGLIATLIVGVFYFAFLLGGAVAPQSFAASLTGGLFSVGMFAGVVLVLVIVGLAAVYTRARSRGDRP